MKGYFSKLMENTGSVFGKPRTQVRGVPIHSDLTTRIEPHPARRSTRTPEQRKRETPEARNPNLIPEKREDLKENQIQSPDPVMDQPSTIPLEKKRETGQRISDSIEAQPGEKQNPGETKIDHPEAESVKFEKFEESARAPAAENEYVTEVSQSLQSQQPPLKQRTLIQKQHVRKERVEIIEKKQDSDPIPAARTEPEPKFKKQAHDAKEIHFKEVREWVAETPEPDEIRAIGEEDVRIRKDGHFSQERCDNGPEASISDKMEPDIQDFHLSIGTVSLTVENPTTEIHTTQSPQPRGNTGSDSEVSTSRLWRHYLRDR